MTRHIWRILSCCCDSKVVWECYITLSVFWKKALNVRRMNDHRPDVKGHAVRHAVANARHISWTTAQHAGHATCSLSKQTDMHDVAGCLWCAVSASRHRSVNDCMAGRVTALHLITPTADGYSCTAGISVSVKTRKPIYRIRRYCNSTSEYSPMCNVGLTLVIILCPLNYPLCGFQPCYTFIGLLQGNLMYAVLIKFFLYKYIHTRLTALFPGLPRWGGTRKVKPIWILLKQETMSGSGICWAICKSAPRSIQTITPLSFLQAGCPSCRPANSVKALKAIVM